MKKYIITSFVFIFIFFGIGSGVTIYHLLNTTSNLRYLINLHETKDIRQSLSFSFQKIQGYTFSSPAHFADNLDEIIDSAELVNETMKRCHECHHAPAIEAELSQVTSQIMDYQQQLSYLITTATEGEYRHEHQLKVLEQSNVILNQIQGMVSRAANTLNTRTAQAMRKIDKSYYILAATLLLTFLALLIVAQYLASHITRPIAELRKAVSNIELGKLGYQADTKGSPEFKQLINTFNSMSGSLAQKEKTIQSTLEKLHQLNLITLPLHAAQDMGTMLGNLGSSIHALIGVDHIGILVPVEEKEDFTMHLFDTGAEQTEQEPILLTRAEVQQTFSETEEKYLLDNNLQDTAAWPFAEKLTGLQADKILLVWVFSNKNVNGALLCLNRKEGDFSKEDFRILAILANNMSVALENIRLLKEAQRHMQELKNTQRQLIEAEKLTALGTLAGGVAHDFNNILCGMIGYVSLLKRNQDPEGKDYKMLNTIEEAGFRAANLTRQLLTFSRQEIMDLHPIDIKPHIENVTKLLQNTISKLITIKLELGESLPQVLSDPAQLEQIVMNLCVNARDAMPNGGQILIRSEQAEVDQKFCDEHKEARPGKYIRLIVSDQGQGIDNKILPRIFDPFFTTKEFGKGTGLGLAMVYGIVKSHRGFLSVKSIPGQGTTFSVYLPEVAASQDEEIQPEVSDQVLQANILIVDDEELVVSMLTEHLQSLGCRTFLARNGTEALDILSRHKDELDMAILDINMPVMDGKTAYEKMLELKPDLKVLVASGYTLNSTAKEILARGAAGFLQKPYTLENITLKIKQVLAMT
ncbi:MAG: response regulator [Deltaproteobacteria bacterium]|jgi:signal transduction histidine kinase/HAMP domain-containing protein|nr:response regulator [Deltaproteobacteria bacterium]